MLSKLEDQNKPVNLANLNVALRTVPGSQTEAKDNPLAVMSENTYNLAVGFGNTEGGIPDYAFKQSGFQPLYPSEIRYSGTKQCFVHIERLAC